MNSKFRQVFVMCERLHYNDSPVYVVTSDFNGNLRQTNWSISASINFSSIFYSMGLQTTPRQCHQFGLRMLAQCAYSATSLEIIKNWRKIKTVLTLGTYWSNRIALRLASLQTHALIQQSQHGLFFRRNKLSFFLPLRGECITFVDVNLLKLYI